MSASRRCREAGIWLPEATPRKANFSRLAAEFPFHSDLEVEVRRYLDIVKHGQVRGNVDVNDMPMVDGGMVSSLLGERRQQRCD